MAIKEDVIVGSTVRDSWDGVVAVRVFTVTTIAASTASGVLLAALREMDANNLYVGASHPDRGDLYVSERVPEPLAKGNNQARVTVTYKTENNAPSEKPVVSFEGNTRQLRTNFDRDQKIIKVSPPAGYAGRDVVGEIADDKSFGVLTAEWWTSSSPRWLCRYQNKVNGGSWFGEPKWAWCVRSVQIAPKVNGRWRVRLLIELDEELWSQVICFRDPITNQIPETVQQKVDKTKLGPVAGKGVTVAMRKLEMDFGKLPIPQDALG